MAGVLRLTGTILRRGATTKLRQLCVPNRSCSTRPGIVDGILVKKPQFNGAVKNAAQIKAAVINDGACVVSEDPVDDVRSSAWAPVLQFGAHNPAPEISPNVYFSVHNVLWKLSDSDPILYQEGILTNHPSVASALQAYIRKWQGIVPGGAEGAFSHCRASFVSYTTNATVGVPFELPEHFDRGAVLVVAKLSNPNCPLVINIGGVSTYPGYLVPAPHIAVLDNSRVLHGCQGYLHPNESAQTMTLEFLTPEQEANRRNKGPKGRTRNSLVLSRFKE